MKHKAAVHFLVNMLEAYYFADPDAMKSVLGTTIQSPARDVETIQHPKNLLKKRAPGFDEREDGEKILDRLDTELVLGTIDTCTWLRSLFAWCTTALCRPLTSKFQLELGAYAIITGRQLANRKPQ